jgi:hypothetical protein
MNTLVKTNQFDAQPKWVAHLFLRLLVCNLIGCAMI